MKVFSYAAMISIGYIVLQVFFFISYYVTLDVSPFVSLVLGIVSNILFTLTYVSLALILMFFKEKKYYLIPLFLYLVLSLITNYIIFLKVDSNVILSLSAINAINFTLFVVFIFNVKAKEVSGLFKYLGIAMLIAAVARVLIPILARPENYPQLPSLSILVSLLPVIVILILNMKMRAITF